MTHSIVSILSDKMLILSPKCEEIDTTPPSLSWIFIDTDIITHQALIPFDIIDNILFIFILMYYSLNPMEPPCTVCFSIENWCKIH